MGDDRDDPKRENLADAAQRQNTNLRRLIGTVGTLLSASRDLLKRMPSQEASPAPDQAQSAIASAPQLAPNEPKDDPAPSPGNIKPPINEPESTATTEPQTSPSDAGDAPPSSSSDTKDEPPPGVTQT